MASLFRRWSRDYEALHRHPPRQASHPRQQGLAALHAAERAGEAEVNPAGLVQSRRLYRASNWREHTPVVYLQDEEGEDFRRVSADMYEYMLMNGYAPFEEVPAYTVGYVLDAVVKHSSLEPAGVLRMLADYIAEGESLADAACRLAIRLFEDGILEKAA